VKIAYLLGSLNRGGSETLLLDCFRHSNEAGFQSIAIHRRGGDLQPEFAVSGVPLHLCHPECFLDFTYFFRLRRLLIKEGVQVVHAQQPLDGLYARLACLNTAIKVVLTLHGYDRDYGQLAALIIRVIIRRTHLNIFVSHTQMKYYLEKYHLTDEARWRVVYNGIDFEKFVYDELSSLREELNIADDCLLLGSVGNFVIVRDQMTICRFLFLLKKSNINFKFAFAGARTEKEADCYDHCLKYCDENGLRDHVFFLGTRSDVPNILGALDAFIYASNSDTFGIAVIEAMAMAVPVFVNDWEVFSEITENGLRANLYATKNEEDLLKQFVYFIEHKELYRQKAKASAIWVKNKFTIMKHIQNLRMAYEAVMGQAKKSRQRCLKKKTAN